MSMTIDQKVVEMRFDNRHFESNVSTTLSSLDKLKKSLNLSGASKGLDNISASAKKVDMSGMGTAVDTVRTKFSALEVMGVTALANITNSAVNCGKRMLSALTIDPIKTGFQEYETQMNAVQTILANTSSKGSTLQDVNKALDELNTYADKTIYNFTEMTRNIGTFTAAGVDLDTSVNAIQGIANLAAVSGSTSQQASTAMYQLSQALAAGTVKLMDWNSVVNAGMGGEVFQNALKETARVHGVAIDKMIKEEGSFRETLSKGWLTSDILTDTLKKFTMAAEEGSEEWNKFKKELMDSGYTEAQAKEILKMANTATDAATKVKTFTQLWDVMKEAAQSGWAQTWRLIVGDFEQAKNLLTPLGDFFTETIGNMSNARNELLEGALGKGFADLGKRISGAIEPAKKAVDTVEKAVDAVADLGAIVDDVLDGKLGNGKERFDALTKAGFNYCEVQNKVNESLGNSFRYTKEQIAAQNKVLASQKKTNEASKESAEIQNGLTDSSKERIKQLAAMSEAELKAIGCTEDQIEAFKELKTVSEKLGLPINELIDNIDQINGRWLLINSFKNAGQGLLSVIKAIGDAWSQVFPPMTSDQLFNVIAGVHRFSTYLKVSEETSGNLTRTLKGLFAILDIIATITGGALKIGFQIFSGILKAFDTDILSFTANIGDSIVALRDWVDAHNYLAIGSEKLMRSLRKGTEVVRGWIDEFMAIPEVRENLANLELAFVNSFSGIKDYFGEGMNRINEFIDRVKSLDDLTLDDLKALFKDFQTNIVDYFLNIDGVTEDVKQAFREFRDESAIYLENIEDGVKDRFSGVYEYFESFRDKLFDIIESIRNKIDLDFGAILTVGVGVGLIVFLKKVGNILDYISSFSLSGFMGLEGVLEAYANKLKSESLRNNAIAIGILAASLAVLSMLDWKKVAISAVILTALYGALIGLSALQNKFGSGDALKLSVSLTAIAGSLLILTLALKQLEGLNWGSIAKGIITLGILAAGMVAVTKVLSSREALSLPSKAVYMIAFAGSLKVLVNVLKDLDKLNVRPATITKLLVCIGGLSLISVAAKGLKAGSFVGLIGAVVSLKLFIDVVEDIAEVDTGKIRNNLDAFIGIFGMFTILMASSHFAGANAAKAGLGIIAMSAALLIVVRSFKKLGEIQPLVIDRAVDVISQLLIVFGLITAMSGLSGKNAAKAGLMLLEMSGALLIISGVMVVLSKIDPAGLDRALKAVVTLSLVFGALIGITALTGELSKTMEREGVTQKEVRKINSTLIILATTIGVLAVALGALSMINPENLKTATICLSSVIGMFAILVASTKLVKKANSSIIIMLSVIGMLSGMLYILSQLEVQNTLEVAESLSVLLLAVSASLVIVSRAGAVSKNAIVSLYAISGALALVAIITGTLTALDVAPSIDTAFALSTLLLAMSGVCVILSKVGLTGPAAIKGALIFDGVVAIVGALMVGIGALVDKCPVMETFLDKGIPVLEKIGYGLGSFFGNIAGGLLSGVTAGLPDIGENLSGFMDEAGSFFEGIKSVDGDAVSGVKSLAETILILTAGDLIQRITSFFGGGSSIENFANQLPILGQAMANYSAAVSGNIDAESVTASSSAAASLANLAKSLPTTGGKIQEWFGEKLSLSTFGSQLVAFGSAIVAYSSTVAGKVDADAVTSSANAGMALADLANNLPKTGGVISEWFLGRNVNLSMFATELPAFGNAIVAYSKTVAGKIDAEAITASANAGMALADLANSLPSTGGVISEWFLGDNISLADFGAQLKAFGESISGYCGAVTTEAVDHKAVERSTNAAKAIAELANNLPTTGGVLKEWFFGNAVNLQTFGVQLRSFGSDFALYAAYMNRVDPSIVEATSNAAASIVTLANSLPDNKLFKNETTLIEFGAQMSTFGLQFGNYYGSISAIDTNKLSEVTSQLWRLVNLFGDMAAIDTSGASGFSKALGKLAKSGLNNFIGEFIDSYPTVVNTVETFIDNIVNKVNGYQQKFLVSGKTVMVGFISGVENKKTSAILVFTTMMNEVYGKLNGYQQKFLVSGKTVMVGFITGVEIKKLVVISTVETMMNDVVDKLNKYTEFYNAGKNCVQGFADGIDENTFLAEARATAMALSALEAAKEALGINSPSRVTRDEIGIPMVQGIAEGIKNNFSAEEAAENKADAINNAFKSELESLDISDQDVDLELDLKTKTAGVTASSDTEKLSNEVETQTERVRKANDDYEVTMRKFGETAETTQEAYGKLLDEKLKLTELSRDLAVAQRKDFEANKAALQSYISWMKESASGLSELGYAYDEINALGKKATGYSGGVSFDFSKSGRGWTEEEMAAGFIPVKETVEENATNVGKAAAEGMSIGMTAGLSLVNKAAANMANTALTAAKKTLDVNSPSKEFYLVGDFSALGFINALLNCVPSAYKAGSEMAESAKSGLLDVASTIEKIISGDLDPQPTIRPVLDLSEIESDTGRLNAMFSRNRAMSISTGMNRDESGEIQNGDPKTSKGNTFNFTQNNYSPKALSRVEIYRQTKNQFSAMERKVNA